MSNYYFPEVGDFISALRKIRWVMQQLHDVADLIPLEQYKMATPIS